MKRVVLLFIGALAGCTSAPTQYATLSDHVISLHAGELEAAGIAFVTPASITGQEQEKQAIALTFTDALRGRAEPPGLGDVRLYFQIWDSRDGSLAWEGMQELRIAVDTTKEQPVTLLERTAHDLVAKVP